MEAQTQIDQKQFFIIIILYILSNDLITGLIGGQLKQDIWIAQTIAVVLSVVLFMMYLWMLKNMNYMKFTDLLKQLVGKKVGFVLILLYSLYFILLSSFNVRDISELSHTYYLNGAPILLLTIIFMIPVYFSVFSGIEVTSRMANLIFFFTYMVFLSFSLLVVFFNKVDFMNFTPLLDQGIRPLIKPTILMSFAGPFGELFVLLIIIQHIKKKKGLFKVTILAQIIASINIILIIVYCISIIGGDTIPFILTPSMRISRKIDIENFIQRLDLFTLMNLIYLTYIKVTILLYGAKECLKTVFKKVHRTYIIFVISGISIYLSLYLVKDYIYYIQFREDYMIPYVKGSFEVGIPFILFILSFFRKPRNQESNIDKCMDENLQENDNATKNKNVFTSLSK